MTGVIKTTYRSNGIDGVHDGKEQYIVDAPCIIRVTGPRDFLTGRVIDVRWPASDVDLTIVSIRHCVTGAAHVLKLYQCLTLLWH